MRHKCPRFKENSFALSRDEYIGSAKITLDPSRKENVLVDIEGRLRETNKPAGSNEGDSEIVVSIVSLPMNTDIRKIQMEEEIGRARRGIATMQKAPPRTDQMEDALDFADGAIDDLTSFADTWDSLLDKIELLSDFVDDLGEVHPYAKIACSVLTVVPKAVIKQRRRDQSLCGLMEAIGNIHTFLHEANPLNTIKLHRETFEKMEILTMASAHLIHDYTLLDNFWLRATTQPFTGVEKKIADYAGSFKQLEKKFRTESTLHIEITVLNCFATVAAMEKDNILRELPYPDKTGFDPQKSCLPGTRAEVLSEVHKWINTPDGDRTPQLLVLTGAAGCGKTTIARTVAQHYKDMEKLGSAVFFEEPEQAYRHCGNVLSTISRDIADLDQNWREALYEAVKPRAALRKTKVIREQLANFIVKPAKALKAIGPIVIVIDALDESGDANARKELLQALVESAAELPSNFRIFITARDETDIRSAFTSKPNVELKPIKDHRDDPSLDDDISAFITRQLSGAFKDNKRVKNCEKLANASGRLFQWAATACRAIQAEDNGSIQEKKLAEMLEANGDLYKLYKSILDRAFRDHATAMENFTEVMGNVLAVKIPLSQRCHHKLWNFTGVDGDKNCHGGVEDDDDRDGNVQNGGSDSDNDADDDADDAIKYGVVNSVVGLLGSLLSGVYDLDEPIRPLHQSFFDFLVGGVYQFNLTEQNRRLALSCLRVMNGPSGLKFNICNLESSHKRNIDCPPPANPISPVLSYACNFVDKHIVFAPPEEESQKLENTGRLRKNKIRRKLRLELLIFFRRNFLFWLEVLSVEKRMNIASGSLAAVRIYALSELKVSCIQVPSCAKSEVHDHEQPQEQELVEFAKDAISFVNVFAPPISESVPHIYLSALPFAPDSSLISKQYLRRYPGVLQLLSGSLDNWPAALKTIEGHTNTVSSVSYSPDGRHIVSASWDRSMYICDAETGEIAAGPFTWHSSPIMSVSYSPDGRHIASGFLDQTVRICNALTGEVVAGPFEGHTEIINSVAWSPDGKYVVSGSSDKTCRIWKIEVGGAAVGRVLEGHSDSVNSVVYSSDGKYIASGSSDRVIRVLDAETYKIVGVPFEGHAGGVSSVAFSPDSRHIVSSSWDKTIRVWDITGQLVAGPFAGHSKGITSVTYSKDGRFLATGSSDKTVRVLDSQTGATVAGPFEGHSDTVRSVAFSPDGRCIVSGAADKTVRVWDAEAIGIAARTVEEGRGGAVLAVACSPDSRHIASGSADGRIRIRNLETGQLVLGPLEGHSDSVRSIAYSPDGKHIVSGSDDRTILIWSGETGTIMARPFQGDLNWVMAVAWSPDGKYIVSGSADKTICVWNATTGDIALGPLTGHASWVTSVASSPDGKYIVSGSWEQTIRLWSTDTGEMVGEPFKGHTDNVLSVAFSPDGHRVVSGSRDMTIRFWDIKTGQTIAGPFLGHSGFVNSVAYSPDGKYITSCSDDKTIRMWDVETGETIAGPFTAHSGEVNSVTYTRDGKYFVSGSWDGTIRVWNVEQALARANLSGGDVGSAGFRDNCPMDKGWVSTASGDLLFWVPSWYREGLLWPSNTAITVSNPTRIDQSEFVHGVRWQEYAGLSAHIAPLPNLHPERRFSSIRRASVNTEKGKVDFLETRRSLRFSSATYTPSPFQTTPRGPAHDVIAQLGQIHLGFPTKRRPAPIDGIRRSRTLTPSPAAFFSGDSIYSRALSR
ncbi:hypothetical protein HWV62_23188 [Athelia sp. TMB]|nr:hypothetical protein HWV62_23188 [Athelia sp. TMB]